MIKYLITYWDGCSDKNIFIRNKRELKKVVKELYYIALYEHIEIYKIKRIRYNIDINLKL